MKPRTKLHLQVTRISNELPNLENVLKLWAFDKLIDHLGYRTKTKSQCLSCGHVWKGKPTGKFDKCPSCYRRLIMKDTKKKLNDQKVYVCALDVKEGFQIVRHFQLFVYQKAGRPPRTFFWEIIQQYINPNGKSEVIARNRGGMGYYMAENFSGDLEIRDRDWMDSKYNCVPDGIYPKYKVLPIYQRNGFKGKVGYQSPLSVFRAITTDSIAETLIKANQIALMSARIGHDRSHQVRKFWSSIKICLRRGYIVKDAITYLDYLVLLEYCGKDLRSPVYVCPKNLNAAHDRLVAYKAKNEKRLKLENQLDKINASQIDYQQAKQVFFGLIFTKDDLTIKVLEHVSEFFEEGETHHHCVFTNEYFKKENSLCFSAQVNGVSIETIELSLSDMKVIQSRGLQNRATERNKDIIALLTSHFPEIQQRYLLSQEVAA